VPEGHDKKIMLTDKLGVIMRYPGLDSFVDLTMIGKSLDNVDEVFGLVAQCIEQIFDEEDVYDSSTTTKEEFIQFIESLTQKQFELVQNFFETMPVLRHKFKITNPKTGVESEYQLEGLQSFFG
jgi:hypothetical protein